MKLHGNPSPKLVDRIQPSDRLSFAGGAVGGGSGGIGKDYGRATSRRPPVFSTRSDEGRFSCRTIEIMLRWLTDKIAATAPQGTSLTEVVRAHLTGADDEAARIVAAIVGLLGTVAYADRNYAPAEEARIRDELARVQGLTGAGIDAICAALRTHIVEISTIEAPVYARELLALAHRDLRLQVLAALVDLAAADGELSAVETNLLRLTVTALGLSQDDYNACQARHRDKL